MKKNRQNIDLLGKNLGLALLLFLYGCEHTLGPEYYPGQQYKSEPNVASVISPNYRLQRVYVGITYKMTDTPESYGEWVGVSNAKVVISGNGQEILFEEQGNSGIYVSKNLNVKAGKLYHLKVTYPDNKKVTGTTRIPSEFRILRPTNGDTISISDTLIWQKSSGAVGYFMNGRIYNGSGYPESISQEVRDTLMCFSEWIPSWYQPEPGDTIRFCVAAIDTNYWNYWSINEYNLEETPYLNGGIGVFGSLVISDTIDVFYKKE
jgi:hypothetical protein